MTDPLPKTEKDLLPVAAILWVALITAVAVTIIDWKIKQDIIRLTSTFYKVYPATMEAQGERTEKRYRSPEVDRHSDASDVLHFSDLDTNPRVETNNVATSNGVTDGDNSAAWGEFLRTAGNSESGTAGNS